jgi:hypothetical protein
MIWKDIIGYDGLYRISDTGKVHSIRSNIMLKGNVDRYGYLHYVLYNIFGKKHHTAHRLVAIHFIENPIKLPEVNHKDGNKLNNSISNLEWITGLGNREHLFSVLGKSFKGENNPSAKLNAFTVGKIKKDITAGISQHSIANKYSISRSTISMIAIGKIWSHIS